MNSRRTVVLCLLGVAVTLASDPSEQHHLALSGDPTCYVLDFISNCSKSCDITTRCPTGTKQASSQSAGLLVNAGFAHHARLENLPLNASCSFVVQCCGVTGASMPFRTLPPSGPARNIPLVYAYFADFGIDDDFSMGPLIKGAAEGEYNMVIHGGDIAYNLAGETGNAFMRTLEPVVSSMPYMAIPGNHEGHDNFTSYVLRFQGSRVVGEHSGSGTNMYYSFEDGLVHFVMINTEVYMFYNQTQSSPAPFQPEEQLAWLEADLAAVNRTRTPWVVVVGHKAWFMDYNIKHPYVIGNFSAFEPLLHRYGADLYLTGHVHYYQRFRPLRGPPRLERIGFPQHVDRECERDHGATYLNPKYLTTIIAGSPGDRELTKRGQCVGYEAIAPQLIGTVAECSDTYGYARLSAVNASHLWWEYRETAPGNHSLFVGGGLRGQGALHEPYHDHLWVVQHNHGPRHWD